jgi:hypothetical protein
MERGEFLPGEAILVGVSIENRSDNPVDHIADLNLDTGRLGFRLSKDGGAPIVTHSLGAWILFPEGHRLLPGDRLCEVFSLAECWQFERVRAPMAYRGDTLRFLLRFSPGTYSLRAGFAALMKQDRKPLPALRIESDSVTFTVRDTADIPKDEAATLEALRSLYPWSPSESSWSEWSGRLSGSRYVLGLPQLAWRALDSLDASTLASNCLSQGRTLTAAAILRRKYANFDRRLHAADAWLASVGRDDRLRPLACFVNGWREQVTVAVKHRMNED